MIERILRACTEHEIAVAEARAAEWMRANPDDVGIATACEQLARMRFASSKIDKHPRTSNGTLKFLPYRYVEQTEELRERDLELSWKRYNENPRLWGAEGLLPFEEAKEWVHALGIWNQVEWAEYINTPMYSPRPRNLPERPSAIPYSPDEAYADEWNGWADWLGNDETLEWRDFEEAREYVRSLGLRDYDDYYDWAMSEDRPPDIPRSPNWAYEEEWADWQDWLGGYRSYEEAREFVRSLGLRTAKEWHDYCASGQKPNDIPKDPRRSYGDKWNRR